MEYLKIYFYIDGKDIIKHIPLTKSHLNLVKIILQILHKVIIYIF
jgi:hypothetical protein